MCEVLTTAQREQIREQIVTQIQDIEERLSAHSQDAVSTDTNELFDEVDRASVEETRRLELNRIQHDKGHLVELKLALRRVESDDFGYCDSCGEEISFKRLRARPDSVLCIDCQSAHEIAQMHMMPKAG
ncbi:TraR/DksA family transcriptional regulator [Dongshaea marina]|uniref:TraR/DksA family transcriptional regulator n=1 Tax=Dongshaea marina TaxID=2047966 RepID=UPI000D3E8253|nr:TraR/DksA family transcriptional regulator [Dongshaea marina]